ncbi:MAG: ATPase [Reyranella sp.]|nr:ATPase [Reyranella sp.]
MNSTRAARVIRATPEQIYEAFMDPAILVVWLPPGDMTGKLHKFEGRVGGGYEMSLFYPVTDQAAPGKTADNEDRVSVRFVELAPPRRIVEVVTFHTDDASLKGEMTIEIGIEPVAGGTEVSFVCTDLPPGLRPEDNEAGSRESLEKLARRFE